MCRSVIFASLFFLTVACKDPVAPAFAHVSAEVNRLPFEYDRGMAIEITVRNSLPDTIYFDFCATALERNTAGAWQWAGGVSCLAVGHEHPLGGMLAIGPGAAREVVLHFYPPFPNEFTESDLMQRHRVRVQVVSPPPMSWWQFVGSRTFQTVTTDPFIPGTDQIEP